MNETDRKSGDFPYTTPEQDEEVERRTLRVYIENCESLAGQILKHAGNALASVNGCAHQAPDVPDGDMLTAHAYRTQLTLEVLHDVIRDIETHVEQAAPRP